MLSRQPAPNLRSSLSVAFLSLQLQRFTLTRRSLSLSSHPLPVFGKQSPSIRRQHRIPTNGIRQHRHIKLSQVRQPIANWSISSRKCDKGTRLDEAASSTGGAAAVRETGKPIAQIARDLGVNEGTLGNWVAKDKAAREGVEGLSRDDAAELKRLRAEVAELRMERDVIKRSVVLWVKEATK
jgi:transposase